MALTDIEKVRLNVGDTETAYFYPILTDEEYEYYLELTNNNISQASVKAAYAIMFQLSTIPSREKTGEIEIWNDNVKNYLALLKLFISDPTLYNQFPNGVTPYAAGIDKTDLYESLSDPNNVKSKLTRVTEESCECAYVEALYPDET